jgi:flagellar biosynthesis protein FliP
LLLNLKFMISPEELPAVYNKKYPTLTNQEFNDVKFIKKTNEALRWFMTKDLDS